MRAVQTTMAHVAAQESTATLSIDCFMQCGTCVLDVKAQDCPPKKNDMISTPKQHVTFK